ncbi:MAG: hypothetical protein MI784_05240 [Cytophagales bacterium]|nr:hypothetical protein [Cytophagales bacterium]
MKSVNSPLCKVETCLKNTQKQVQEPFFRLQQLKPLRAFVRLEYLREENCAEFWKVCRLIRESLRDELRRQGIEYIRFSVALNNPEIPYRDFEFDFLV